MELLREKRYLGMLGNLLVLVGTFLPLLTVTVSFLGVSQSQSISWINTGLPAYITIILTAFSLLVIFSDLLKDKVSFVANLENQKLTLISTAVTAVILILNIVNYSKSGASALLSSVGTTTWGIGLWLMAIGLVLSAVYPFLYKGSSK